MRVPRMTSRQYMVLVLAVAVSLAGWRVWTTAIGSGRGYDCSICRMHRGDRSFFGQVRSLYFATDFSSWYSVHIQPQHEHLWEPEANIAIYNLFGQLIEGGTGAPKKIPINLLAPSQH